MAHSTHGGRNRYGQLGLNNMTNQNTPTQVGSDNDWKTIVAGDSFSLALKSDGTLYACKKNKKSQTR